MAHTPLSRAQPAASVPRGADRGRWRWSLAAGVIAAARAGCRWRWIAGPLGAWVAVLLLPPGPAAAKRAVLFMIGTALALTLAVELVAVKGDIDRMNTVFKFYFQAWTLLSLSAAAALAWLLPTPGRLAPAWTRGLADWPVACWCSARRSSRSLAGQAKINDRMMPDCPHTLDGMAYMAYATLRRRPDRRD